MFSNLVSPADSSIKHLFCLFYQPSPLVLALLFNLFTRSISIILFHSSPKAKQSLYTQLWWPFPTLAPIIESVGFFFMLSVTIPVYTCVSSCLYFPLSYVYFPFLLCLPLSYWCFMCHPLGTIQCYSNIFLLFSYFFISMMRFGRSSTFSFLHPSDSFNSSFKAFLRIVCWIYY